MRRALLCAALICGALPAAASHAVSQSTWTQAGHNANAAWWVNGVSYWAWMTPSGSSPGVEVLDSGWDDGRTGCWDVHQLTSSEWTADPALGSASVTGASTACGTVQVTWTSNGDVQVDAPSDGAGNYQIYDASGGSSWEAWRDAHATGRIAGKTLGGTNDAELWVGYSIGAGVSTWY